MTISGRRRHRGNVAAKVENINQINCDLSINNSTRNKENESVLNDHMSYISESQRRIDVASFPISHDLQTCWKKSAAGTSLTNKQNPFMSMSSSKKQNHGGNSTGIVKYKSLRNALSGGIFVFAILTSILNLYRFSGSYGSGRNDINNLLIRKSSYRYNQLPKNVSMALTFGRNKASILSMQNETKSSQIYRVPMSSSSSIETSKQATEPSLNPRFIVRENDYIYKRDLSNFDAAPIIVPEYKLAFFSIPKVACTTFKFLFRRLQGIKRWDDQDEKLILPHNPKYNNLTYLWDYSLEEANEIMTSSQWTRAIFVREPKQRFLSAFLDKAIGNDGWHVIKACCQQALVCQGIGPTRKEVKELLNVCHEDTWDSRNNVLVPQWDLDMPCCTETKACREKAETIEGFLDMIQTCHDEHWVPQYDRMEKKYWKYINFVGHMETMKEDTQRLLEKIGAWERWGTILEESEYTQSHITGSNYKIYQWYTPERERLVEAYYAADYNNPIFNFTVTNLTEPIVSLPDGEFVKQSDKIYSRNDWDGAPVVIKKYKLIFFTMPKVGGTKWKQAFRRMMDHVDWKEVGGVKGLPHDPVTNGLKYLYDYPIHEAETMMTSPDWTRAIFVRNPKDRFLSVYYHMSRNRDQVDTRCCPHQQGCSSTLRSMIDFIELMETCYSAHWAPIAERMEDKYWPYINFIGSLENVEEDSKKLLKRIGAWEAIGRSGWGKNGNDQLFGKDDHAFDKVLHSLSMYSPAVDKMLDSYYRVDYEHKYLNFSTRKVFAMEHGTFTG